MYPTFSLVIEWENGRLSEGDRALEMLGRLNSQISELGLTPAAQPEVILLYNAGEVEPRVIEDAVAQAAAPDRWPADLTILPANASTYYEQKNIGAARVARSSSSSIATSFPKRAGWPVFSKRSATPTWA